MSRTDKIIEWLKNNKVISIIVVCAIIIAGIASTLKNLTEIKNFIHSDKVITVDTIPKKDSIYPTIPIKQVKSIATSLLKESPEFCGYTNIYGTDYIMAFTKSNNRFTLFKRFNQLWEDVQHVDSLGEINQFMAPDDWEFSTIDSLPALFFATGGSGNTFGSADFYLIPFKKDFSYSVYNISVSGALKEGAGNAIFDNTDYSINSNELAKLDNNFARYLSQKFNQYNPVPPLSEKDANLDMPQNALKAWEVDNADWLTKVEVNDEKAEAALTNIKVKFKYYKEDLPKLLNSETEVTGSEEPADENENFVLYDVFKYAAIIKDKKSANFFVAFGHDNVNVGGIRLQDDNLYVSDQWYFTRPFLINLKSGLLTLLPKAEEAQAKH